jgi:hypothetical protein
MKLEQAMINTKTTGNSSECKFGYNSITLETDLYIISLVKNVCNQINRRRRRISLV